MTHVCLIVTTFLSLSHCPLCPQSWLKKVYWDNLHDISLMVKTATEEEHILYLSGGDIYALKCWSDCQ